MLPFGTMCPMQVQYRYYYNAEFSVCIHKVSVVLLRNIFSLLFADSAEVSLTDCSSLHWWHQFCGYLFGHIAWGHTKHVYMFPYFQYDFKTYFSSKSFSLCSFQYIGFMVLELLFPNPRDLTSCSILWKSRLFTSCQVLGFIMNMHDR